MRTQSWAPTRADEAGSRERVLSDAELVAIWNAAPDNDYGSNREAPHANCTAPG